MRLVDHHDVVVAVQHRDVERHRHLVGQLAIQVHMRAGGQHRRRVDHRAVGVNHFAGKHFRASLAHRTETATRPAPAAVAQPHPRRAEPVAHRQRRGTPQLSGTGSRISARASGAAARSASADSSSGCCCDRTSASTRAHVGRHLAVDVLGAPAQHRRNDFGDLAGAVDTAVRVLDRDPHPPGQDVLEVQRALGRGGVPRLDLQVHRRLGDRRQQLGSALGQSPAPRRSASRSGPAGAAPGRDAGRTCAPTCSVWLISAK